VVAAATCLVLLPMNATQAADPTTSPDSTQALPTAPGLTHHPLAVPGSTAQRRAAMQRLTPEVRERLTAQLAKMPMPAGKPAMPEPSKADPWQAWPEIVAGKAPQPSAVSAQFTQRPPAKTSADPGLNWDGDSDGLDDGFEGALADAFTPVYHVSWGEQPWTGFAMFADQPNLQTVWARTNPPVPPVSHYRVQPLGFGTNGAGQQVGVLRVDYLTLWNWDDGLDVSSACIADLAFLGGWVGFSAGLILDGLQWHEFDPERSAALLVGPVAEPWVFNQDPNAYAAYSYYTAAHEGTFTDQSMYLWPSPVPAHNHLNVALSRQKHATYPFNPHYLPLIHGDFQGWVYSTIDFLWFAGIITDEWLYWALLGIADSLFYGCFVERFYEQGGWFSAERINVGEPGRPINGSSWIADGRIAEKLVPYIW
jgi:hypothetical protein